MQPPNPERAEELLRCLVEAIECFEPHPNAMTQEALDDALEYLRERGVKAQKFRELADDAKEALTHMGQQQPEELVHEGPRAFVAAKRT